jgi:hypothetical protein
LDSSGNVRDSILTGGASTGDLSLEVSDHQAMETYLEAVMGSIFTNDVLKNDKNQRFFLLEKMFPDIPAPGSDSYHRFDRSAFSALGLSIAPGAPITATITVNGGELTLGTAPISGATYPDPGTEPVLVPQDVEVIVGGIASTSCFSAVNVNMDTNARDIQCIGTLGTKESVRGRLAATIEATLYYASDAPVEALIDQTEFPVDIILSDADGNPQFTFHFPRCKMTAAPVVAPGTDQDVTVAMSIQALYDADAECTVIVTRQPAVPGEPVAAVAPVVTGPGTVGSTLTCDGGTFVGAGTITKTYSWISDAGPFSPLQTGSTLNMATALPAPQAGDVIYCEVTATNTAGTTMEQSNSVTVTA